MTNLDNDGFFEQLNNRRAARDRTTDERAESVARLRALMLRYFDPILDMIGSMYAAGIRFPAGRVPSREAARVAAEKCSTGPRLSISIDTRRELILEVTVRDAQLSYSAYIWEISTKTSLLETTELSAVRAWLVEQVSQFEYQPSRQAQAGRTGRPGMPPAMPHVPWEPDEVPVEDDDDEPDGREQRVIDLNE